MDNQQHLFFNKICRQVAAQSMSKLSDADGSHIVIPLTDLQIAKHKAKVEAVLEMWHKLEHMKQNRKR